MPARFALLSTLAVLFDHLGGPEAAVAMVPHRAGRWFDPDLAETFLRSGPDLLRRLAEVDVWNEILAVKPEPNRRIPPTQVDEVARVFADMVDLKTPFTLGHFAAVADLAVAAARQLRFSDDDVSTLRARRSCTTSAASPCPERCGWC